MSFHDHPRRQWSDFENEAAMTSKQPGGKVTFPASDGPQPVVLWRRGESHIRNWQLSEGTWFMEMAVHDSLSIR
jgi:hypothetical protein